MVSLVAAFLMAADVVPGGRPAPAAPPPALAPLPAPEPAAATNAPAPISPPPQAPAPSPAPAEAPSDSAPATTNAAPEAPRSLIGQSKHPNHVYPWHTHVLTQLFTLGAKPADGGDVLNDGWSILADASTGETPDAGNGSAPADHVLKSNTFYVALPFNDLAYPAVAARFLPTGWIRDIQNGKVVSSCQHRWIEIKNADGKLCYAQWEDVGPAENTRAEYVFAREPAGAAPALGLSPAVAQYLKINPDDPKTTSVAWRFIEDEDVPPGTWLKYEEEAILYNALHDENNPATNAAPVVPAPAPPATMPDVATTNAAPVVTPPQPATPVAAPAKPQPKSAPSAAKKVKPAAPAATPAIPARPVTPSTP